MGRFQFSGHSGAGRRLLDRGVWYLFGGGGRRIKTNKQFRCRVKEIRNETYVYEYMEQVEQYFLAKASSQY